MFLVKKLVTPFLVPPGLFILVVLAAGLAMILRRRWRAGAALALLGLSMWLAATPFAARPLAGILEAGLELPRRPQGDVIVLLGGGIDPWALDLSGSGVPTPAVMARIVTAVRLQRSLNLPILVSGGRVFHQPVSEAAVTARFLAEMGVPAHRILQEEQSRDTAENARYSAAICRRRGYSRPILVSQATHLKRAVFSFRTAGLNPTPLPVALHRRLERPGHWSDWLPRSYEGLADALHECLGLIYYRMTLATSVNS